MGNICKAGLREAGSADVVSLTVIDDLSSIVSSEGPASPVPSMWSPHSGFSTMTPPSPRSQRIYDLIVRSHQ